MKKLPNFVKWLIIAVVLAAMAAMMVAVNDRANPGKDQTAATWVATNLLVTCRLQLCTREIGTRRDGHSGVTPTALHFHNEVNPCFASLACIG